MALKRFRPDRSFDGFNKDEVVELDTEDEVAARYIRTGYLEEVDGDDQADAPAEDGAEAPPADALSQTTVGDQPTDTPPTDGQDAPAPDAPATTKRSRRSRSEGDSAPGAVDGSGDSGQ